MIGESGKYGHYSLVVNTDHGRVLVEQDEDTGRWVRYHCRIFRVPSRREFALRHCVDATEHDRRQAEKALMSMPSGGWARFGDRWLRRRSSHGNYYVWSVFVGRYIDDPLVQLELEMMIDQSRSAVVQ